MKPPDEFNFLIINTQDLWDEYQNKEKSNKIELDRLGILLESTTSFSYDRRKILNLNINSPVDFAFDSCNIFYVIDGSTGKIGVLKIPPDEHWISGLTGTTGKDV